MSDPRLHSLHLEGQPRREQFRAARQAIQAACGTHTLAGDLRMLVPDERLDASTMAAPPGGVAPGALGRFTFYLKDGTNVYPFLPFLVKLSPSTARTAGGSRPPAGGSARACRAELPGAAGAPEPDAPPRRGTCMSRPPRHASRDARRPPDRRAARNRVRADRA